MTEREGGERGGAVGGEGRKCFDFALERVYEESVCKVRVNMEPQHKQRRRK